MAADLPYMPAVGNVPAILEKMRGAGTPPKFTLEFLKSSLGFNSSQDRSFPKLLKQLRFISADGVPQDRYNEFKSVSSGGRALADGLREGWAEIFLADESAQNRSVGELTDLFKTVTGQSEAVAKKMASTFSALSRGADWSNSTTSSTGGLPGVPDADVETGESPLARGGLSLHHDIHLHLPPTSDVGVYRAIFRALREELQ